MTLVSTRTAEISQIEGFRIIPMRGSSDLVMTEQSLLGRYRWKNRADDNITISKWTKDRFQKCYLGYSCRVVDMRGDTMHGSCRLKTARSK